MYVSRVISELLTINNTKKLFFPIFLTERFQGVNASTEDKQGETSGDPKLRGDSLFPLNESQRKSLSPSSGMTNDLTSPPKSTIGGE